MSTLLVDSYEEIKERMEYMPVNYKSTRAIGVGTATAIDPQQIFANRIKSYVAPLWRLQSKTKRFYTPIPIAVKAYRDEDFFFAENENLAVCGTGDTPQDALQDLELHITHFFEYYENLDNSQLAGDALRLKNLYKNLLIEE
ncbi:MAG: hypothetical protein KJ770_03630 [Actinobacteria bacterium]|nr:hypothetical protein [Actinomycetota bacterium]